MKAEAVDEQYMTITELCHGSDVVDAATKMMGAATIARIKEVTLTNEIEDLKAENAKLKALVVKYT